MVGETLSSPGIPVCAGRDCPSVSILLCSTGKHIALNTCSWIHPGWLYESVSIW